MKNINTETLYKYTLNINCSLKDALEKLNKLSSELTLFVIDNQNKLIGTITEVKHHTNEEQKDKYKSKLEYKLNKLISINDNFFITSIVF